jgi:hypothetical protein
VGELLEPTIRVASRRDRREFEKLEAKNKKLEAELERARLALDIVGYAEVRIMPRFS